MQDEVNQEESGQDEVDGMKKGADSRYISNDHVAGCRYCYTVADVPFRAINQTTST